MAGTESVLAHPHPKFSVSHWFISFLKLCVKMSLKGLLFAAAAMLAVAYAEEDVSIYSIRIIIYTILF